jgi:hypothetical protein
METKRLLEKGEERSFCVRQQRKESQVHIKQTNHERNLLDLEKCQETKKILHKLGYQPGPFYARIEYHYKEDFLRYCAIEKEVLLMLCGEDNVGA